MGVDFIDLLLQNGAMGLFAAYLVYRDTKSDKKLDDMQESFLGKIEDITKLNTQSEEQQLLKFEEREQKLRDKYDGVVLKLDGERKGLTEKISSKLDVTSGKMESITDKLIMITSKFDEIGKRILLVEQKVNQLDGQISGIKLLISTNKK